MRRLRKNDYVRVECKAFVSKGWVDEVRDKMVNLQCDDGDNLGLRGITIDLKFIVEILPFKPRPLMWWKRELCKKCELHKDWLHQCEVRRVDKSCPWVLEMTMAGAVPL
jgi:hypothetical protein